MRAIVLRLLVGVWLGIARRSGCCPQHYFGSSSTPVLVAATYGRGIWQTALWSAVTGLSAAAASPSSLAFPSQVFGTASGPMTVTLNNTGSVALAVTSISMSGDFSETDNCVNAAVAVGASCAIQVTFTPQATGPLSGEMTIYANVYGGQLTVDLTGTGAPAGAVSLTPASVPFGLVEVGTTSSPLSVTATNSGTAAIPINSVSITPPFVLLSNACGTTSLAASADCQLQVEFAPTQAGPASGLLTFTDGAGTQTVELSGTGASAPTDVLNPTSLAFPSTPEGQLSAAETVTLTNSGGVAADFDRHLGERAVPGDEHLRNATCSRRGLHRQRDFRPRLRAGAVTGTLTVADALRTQTVSFERHGTYGAGL